MENSRFGHSFENWEKAKSEAQEYLVENVAKLGNTITYGNLALAVKTIRLDAHSDAMSNFLDEISRKTFDAHGFMLSTLVVTRKNNLPGQGFWTLARVLNGEQKSWDHWYWAEKQKIFEHYKQK